MASKKSETAPKGAGKQGNTSRSSFGSGDFKPETLKSTPIAVSGSAMGEVRTSSWTNGPKSGRYVQIRKVQMKGRDEPAQVTSVTMGDNPETIELFAQALMGHAKALRVMTAKPVAQEIAADPQGEDEL